MANPINLDYIKVRIAENQEEIEAAQRLRYTVFYEEYSAKPTELIAKEKRDFDDFDDFADHLVVVDETLGKGSSAIVGTYRLLRREAADRKGGFYTSSEFDLSPLLDCEHNLLELGRSCVLPDYRTRPVMQLLWHGIAKYLTKHDINLMFGCASIHCTDIEKLAPGLSYMYQNHMAPEDLRPKALDHLYIDMNILPEDQIDARRVFTKLPPLIKGYLRLGAFIGDGAIIDPDFQTTDVCIVLPTHFVTDRYRKHFERTTGGNVPISKSSKKSETSPDTDK